MTTDPAAARLTGDYVCPACKGPLQRDELVLRCVTCRKAYPANGGIPDFLLEDLATSSDPVLRRMRTIDRMARLYETRLWYPIVLKLFGGAAAPSLEQLVRQMARTLEPVKGRVLDVACGPGTFGRHVASPSREVYGVDVSMGMLRQGAAYAAKEDISNIRFARTRVESLPFVDAWFDAAICCGSLHLFADTTIALREIARVKKPAGVLSSYTFAAGRGGILRFRKMREWYRSEHGLHVFDLDELEGCLSAAGFTSFRPQLFGSLLAFNARKAA